MSGGTGAVRASTAGLSGALAERPLRLAMFSPMPPAPTGIADYVAGLLDVLPARWQIDVFAEERLRTGRWVGRRQRVLPHEQWWRRQRMRPYDLAVYHIGNSEAHHYVTPIMQQKPGLLVLHDVVLHPSRAAHHLRSHDLDGYRAALQRGRPDVANEIGHLVVGGFGTPALYWNFPMCEDLVRANLVTVVHGDLLARWLRAQLPEVQIDSVVHWLPVPDPPTDLVATWRADLGANGERPLIGTFGHMGSEHRIAMILDVLADIADDHEFVFVAVGSAESELARLPAARRLGHRMHWTGRVSDLDFGALMRATDIAINLRYPTARASSGAQQQLLQSGTPTVIHDLIHLRGIPADAVQRVPTGTADEEQASLRAALIEWLADPIARRRAAAEAQRWAARTITREAMAASYVAAVGQALAAGDES